MGFFGIYHTFPTCVGICVGIGFFGKVLVDMAEKVVGGGIVGFGVGDFGWGIDWWVVELVEAGDDVADGVGAEAVVDEALEHGEWVAGVGVGDDGVLAEGAEDGAGGGGGDGGDGFVANA